METVLAIFVAFLTVVGVVYCVVRPRIAIVPVLMLFPVEQILMGYLPELRIRYGWLTNVVVGLIAVFGILFHFFRGDPIFKGVFNKLFFAVVALFTFAVVSMLWTPAPDSAQYFLGQSWAYFFLFYCVAPMLVKDLDELSSVAVPLIVTGIIVMALMLINPNAKFINDRFVVDLGYVVGYGTLISNPLAIADAGAILAIVAAIYQPNQRSAMITTLKWAGVLLGLALALLSGSRMQVVASVGIIAALLPFASGARSAARVAGSVLVMGIVLAFLYFVFTNFLIGAGQSRWTEENSAEGFAQRLDMALTIITGYLSSPAYWLIGLGAAAFNAFYALRTRENPHWFPHNIVVESVTEYGLIGLLLLGAILYMTAKYSLRLIAVAGNDRRRRTTAIIFIGIVIFQFIMSLKQGYMLGMPPLFMFCLIVARVAKNEESNALAAYNQSVYDGTADQEAVEQDGHPPEEGWSPEPEPA
jgi:hypothetical protein